MNDKPNEMSANIFIGRDSFIKMKVSQGRGNDKTPKVLSCIGYLQFLRSTKMVFYFGL